MFKCLLVCTKDNYNFPTFQQVINLYVKLFEPAPLLIYVRSACTTYQEGVAIYPSLLGEKHINIESTSEGT